MSKFGWHSRIFLFGITVWVGIAATLTMQSFVSCVIYIDNVYKFISDLVKLIKDFADRHPLIYSKIYRNSGGNLSVLFMPIYYNNKYVIIHNSHWSALVVGGSLLLLVNLQRVPNRAD